MAEPKPGKKKTAVKKSVSQPAAKKITGEDETTSDAATPTPSTAPKKASSAKKAVQKKSAAKKARIKKSVATKPANQNATDNSKEDPYPASRRAADREILTTIKSIVGEMRNENETRDKQMMLLVNEIHQGFRSYAEHTNEKVSAQDREMDQLHDSLKSAFNSVEDSSKNSDERSHQILKALSESIMMDHEQTLQEVQQQKKLQDERIEHLTELEQRRSSRSRWLAVPGTIMAIIAIIYMFYVVNVMEAAMTNMSRNMDSMQASVGNMSDNMDTMAEDTHVMQSGMRDMTSIMSGMAADTKVMSGDMSSLNHNLTQVSYDLNIMTRNVSPAMRGLHDMMPWSP